MNTLLGLDLGTHSIGWTLIEMDADEVPARIVGTGARIFNQVLDDKTQSPKNEERRMARLRRRQTARRVGTHLPPAGEVRMLLITDHLFGKMELFAVKNSRQAGEKPPEQLTFL